MTQGVGIRAAQKIWAHGRWELRLRKLCCPELSFHFILRGVTVEIGETQAQGVLTTFLLDSSEI